MRDHLRALLATTNDWLKFAEAKNLAALAFAGAAIGSYVRAVDIVGLPVLAKSLVSCGIAGLTIAAIAALVSFMPTIKIPFLDAKRVPREADNLLFYGDIAYYKPSELLTRTKEVLGTSSHEAIDEHYATQIIINSRIAIRKNKIFVVAGWAALLGITLLAAGGVARLVT